MNLLLDTHVFLWWLADDARLSLALRQTIADPDNTCSISAASSWEIAIKLSIGKLRLDDEAATNLAELPRLCGFDDLAITHRHAAHVRSLPLHHTDPFDRVLIAQAQIEGMTIATVDPVFGAYPVAVVPIG